MNSTFTNNFKPIRKKVREPKKDEDEDEGEGNDFAPFSPGQSDESDIETDDDEGDNINVEDESDLESIVTYPSDQSDTEDERKRVVKYENKKLLPGSLPISKNFKILQEDNDFEDE